MNIVVSNTRPSEEERKAWMRLNWRLRLEQEIKDYLYASFSTYTFAEYPKDQIIPSSLWQLYMKRVRKRLNYSANQRFQTRLRLWERGKLASRPERPAPVELRYLSVMELGSETSRPHYHALITSSVHISRPDLIKPWFDYSPKSQPPGWINGEIADVFVLKSPDRRVGSYWARQRQLRAKQRAKRNRAIYPSTPHGTARYLAKYMYKDQGEGFSRVLASRNPMIGLTNGLEFLATAAERIGDLCSDEATRLNERPEVEAGNLPKVFLNRHKGFRFINEMHSRAYDRSAVSFLGDQIETETS